MTKAWLICDGQWGSTGKGLLAGYLALKNDPDTVVCNFGPNAGHTCILPSGEAVMTQILPSAIVSPSIKTILIGPGAIIDPEIMKAETVRYQHFLRDKDIFIHNMASVVTQKHRDYETQSLNRISSTCKGTGASQVDKMMRVEGAVATYYRDLSGEVVDGNQFTELLNRSNILQIESAQGMELGINTGGWYPYCTSRDINVYQVLSDCGIPYSMPPPKVYVTMRTYPIRVGDSFNCDGEKIGTSGPVYDDQEEVSWELLGLQAERTTVTKKIRRVFTWSNKNLNKVLTMLHPHAIFLNFVNYYEDEPSFTSPITRKCIQEIEGIAAKKHMKTRVQWIGTGPQTSDIIERRVR